jgi:hypothetical protein
MKKSQRICFEESVKRHSQRKERKREHKNNIFHHLIETGTIFFEIQETEREPQNQHDDYFF